MNSLSVLKLDAKRYTPHHSHGESTTFVEKNCYVDVWIEALHAAGLEPMAMLPFTLATDFDGDQWTFFKPPHSDLYALYGIAVQELNVYKPLLEHALYHVARGRLIFTEADAFWLPDTRGTDYRTSHTKSTIVIESIDVERQRLGYFHNAGYFELCGEDFVKSFRLDAAADPTFMPLFAELVKLDRAEKLERRELARRSLGLLPGWFARRPGENPLLRFATQFERELLLLRENGLAAYHAYAFATLRQCGACFELVADYLRWLAGELDPAFETSVPHFQEISNLSKALVLKGARAVNSNKPIDFAATFVELSARWEAGMAGLAATLRS